MLVAPPTPRLEVAHPVSLTTTIEHRLRERGGRLGAVARHTQAIRERAERDRVSIVAAGLAFYVALSIVPALVATVAVYSWLRSPSDLFQRIETWTTALPSEVQRLLAGQLLEIAGTTGAGVGISFAGSILATFWAASKASRALMTTLNIAYGLDERRGGGRRRAIAVATVVAGVVFAAVALAIADTGADTAGSWWATAGTLLFWVALLAAAAGVSALAYRFAPNRDGGEVGPVLPGTVVSTVVFAVASVALAVYAATADLSRAYGALGALIGAALWLLVIAWGLLIGAYVNVEFEERRAS